MGQARPFPQQCRAPSGSSTRSTAISNEVRRPARRHGRSGLAEVPYFAGPQYSIADIAIFSRGCGASERKRHRLGGISQGEEVVRWNRCAPPPCRRALKSSSPTFRLRPPGPVRSESARESCSARHNTSFTDRTGGRFFLESALTPGFPDRLCPARVFFGRANISMTPSYCLHVCDGSFTYGTS